MPIQAPTGSMTGSISGSASGSFHSVHVIAQNINYGLSVATYGNYVVVGNPDLLSYDPATGSFHTGSVDIFLYNKSTDKHDYVGTLVQPWRDIDLLMTTEVNNSPSSSTPISTESSSLTPYPAYDISIDKNLYEYIIENGYGISLDMYKTFLVVGNPYQKESTQTQAGQFISSSWAMVDIYDVSQIVWPSLSSSAALFTIDDPNFNATFTTSGSFGDSVSINAEWVAIGAPSCSGSNGLVYLYQNKSVGTNYSWSLFQTLQAPVTAVSQSQFGYNLKLNKYDGPHSNSLIVGCGNPMNSQAYYFEFLNNVWTQTFVFNPDMSVYPMTFNPKYYPQPQNLTMNIFNGFGMAVGCYGDAVIIGEPFDRSFYEFTSSSLYQQGSTYIFERCVSGSGWNQVLKTYGTPTTLFNNRMGFTVDMFGTNAVSGIPKINEGQENSCYIEGTLNQVYQCDIDLQTIVNGQVMLLQQNTQSGAWGITNVYQKKKQFLNPFRDYGFDVAVADLSMVVGAPMLISDINRVINTPLTQSGASTLGDLMGKAYIYDFDTFRDQFHVGNVFYRNGKIIIMTSGSAFDGLFYNPLNTNNYEYDMEFNSQHTIYEKQIICTVDPGEFNVSTNPTAITKNIASFDINGNGVFDFQDADVILRYMQYKYTSVLGVPVSTDWSSSVVNTIDEVSLYNYYVTNYDNIATPVLFSQSLYKWETVDTDMQTILDLNQDGRIDIPDMYIMWKYFSHRLTQDNYALYITPTCVRRLFSDVTDYLNGLTGKYNAPMISSDFLDYERLTAMDNTGSYLAPMATYIGIYDGLQLIALGKLGTPIKITPELPINFVVKMDF